MLQQADYNFIVKYGEVTPDGVAVYDLNTRKFVYANRFLRQILEDEDKDLMSDPETLLRLVHHDDLAYVDHRYRELLSIGCIAPVEFRLKFNDTVKHVSIEVIWLEESYTFALFARDVTLQREHEDHVLKFTSQKNALLGMLVHKLSSSLHTTPGELTLPPGADAGTRNTSHNGSLKNAAEQTIDLINDFVDREYEASAQVPVNKSRFDVVSKLENLLDILKRLNIDKRFEVVARLNDRNVYTDGVKFLQVAQIILSNAVKYTTENGQITITLEEEKPFLKIFFKDNGIGIPVALLPNLMKQKVLGTPGLSGEKGGGSGLLYASRLVELLEGEMGVESSEGEGTLVTLSFRRE